MSIDFILSQIKIVNSGAKFSMTNKPNFLFKEVFLFLSYAAMHSFYEGAQFNHWVCGNAFMMRCPVFDQADLIYCEAYERNASSVE